MPAPDINKLKRARASVKAAVFTTNQNRKAAPPEKFRRRVAQKTFLEHLRLVPPAKYQLHHNSEQQEKKAVGHMLDFRARQSQTKKEARGEETVNRIVRR